MGRFVFKFRASKRYNPPMPKRMRVSIVARTLLLACSLAPMFVPWTAAQDQERVHSISPPSSPLPPEDQTRDVKRFSFIVYGDTRGRRDGIAIQYEHSLVIDSMISHVKQLQSSPFPRAVRSAVWGCGGGRQASQPMEYQFRSSY